MSTNIDGFISKIRDGIATYLTVDVFSGNSDKELIVACREFLKYKGYKIVDPISDKTDISSIKDLVDLFYNLKAYSYPEEYNAHRNTVLDLRSARFFVEARMNAENVIKEQALKECALIIRTLFTHEKEFKFKYPITLFSLGQKKSGWITEKALEIMNKVSYNRKEREAEELRQAVLNNQDTSFNLFDGVLKEMEKEDA